MKEEYKLKIEKKILGATNPADIIKKYPPDLATLDYFNLGSEYVYQVFRGAKVVNKNQLDQCENNITELSYHFNNAIRYF